MVLSASVTPTVILSYWKEITVYQPFEWVVSTNDTPLLFLSYILQCRIWKRPGGKYISSHSTNYRPKRIILNSNLI